MKQKITIVQAQKQQMSSKLIPSMNILHMGYHDLEQLINTSLMDNPFADIADSEVSVELVEGDCDYKKAKRNNAEFQPFDIVDENTVDLIAHIRMQIEKSIKNKKDSLVVMFLLESLDAKGYLNEDLLNVCNLFELSESEGLYYLRLLQSVEPKGVGARDLKECLLLQLDDENDKTKLAQIIVKKYLEYVGARNYTYIAKQEKISIIHVEEAVSLIKSLNPIPANGFAFHERTAYIVPDVYIESGEQEKLVVLNCGFEEKLKMNNSNYDIYKQAQLDKQSKKFLAEKLHEFNLLKYGTTRRGLTLKKVITVLVEYQKKFFETGAKKDLKPLRLVDVEKMTGLHSSTISRALHDKFFQCAYGTFPLQTLVPKTYSKHGKEPISRSLMKAEVMEIIKNEDKKEPFSDQKIAMILQEDGYEVSRRSVNKYREEMNIPAAKFRKEIM